MEIDEITKAIILLVRAGVFMRIAFCFLRMMGDEDESPMYKKRAIHAGLFYIIAESIWQLKDIVFYYFA
ncbi:mercury transporter [Desulfosporosinus nitroreducens]|uniref:Mercury transporter n=1 Tax=Desulfosporosinus nitroreducens TaxID=2018668 RepID=A0ABT8QRU2_9FIRM|nr:mercury transporter [Desulfosporosinus nitroreducens]MDO0824066.1 mercury transporter [Desulfosporosinus nitroreducens]